MRERRLLERMALSDTPAYERASGPDKRVLLESVSQHLQRILNTRKGTVLADPEFGVPDFSTLPGGFSTPETDEVVASIISAIEAYEPRLSEVDVRFDGVREGDPSMRFVLSGVIQVDEQSIPLRLSTEMGADSSFEFS